MASSWQSLISSVFGEVISNRPCERRKAKGERGKAKQLTRRSRQLVFSLEFARELEKEQCTPLLVASPPRRQAEKAGGGGGASSDKMRSIAQLVSRPCRPSRATSAFRKARRLQ